MIERVIDFSLRNRFLVVVLSLILVVLGVRALLALPIDAVPDVTNVQVQVLTNAPALGPLEVEKFVTTPVETVMSGLPRLEEIRSVSKFGLSSVTVVFEEGTDIYFARQLVGERLGEARESIPEGYGSPEMGPISSGLGEIYQFEVRGDGRQSAMELRTVLEWFISPQLRQVPGVIEVNAFGGELKTYEVQVDPQKLVSYRIPIQTLFEALEKNSANAGGAYIARRQEQVLIRGEGLIESLEDIENIVLATSDERVPVTIRNVATVGFAPMVRQGAVTRDGRGEVAVGIVMMLMGENSRVVVDRVKQKIDQVKKSLPPGVTIDTFYDRTDLVRMTIKTVSKNLLEGGLLVIAILLLLLGNLRAGLIVASAIPLSMLIAFIGMVRTGISGNLMSLGAIDFGLIVDGSVVMIENVVRLLSDKSRRDRSVSHIVREAAREVGRPIVFAVGIIIIVYLPLLSLTGIEGKMFKPMAYTVIFALVGSLVLSLTLMPVLATFFLRHPAQRSAPSPWFSTVLRIGLLALAALGVELAIFSGIVDPSAVSVARTAVFVAALALVVLTLLRLRIRRNRAPVAKRREESSEGAPMDMPPTTVQEPAAQTIAPEPLPGQGETPNLRRQVEPREGLHPDAEHETWLFRRMHAAYRPMLATSVAHPWATIGISLLLLVASLMLVPFMGAEFLPRLDEGAVALQAWRLPSVSIEESIRQTGLLEKALKKLPEVITVVSKTGRPEIATDPMGVEISDVFVILKPHEEWTSARDRETLVQQMHELLTREVPGSMFSFSQPIELRVSELIAGVRSDVAIKLYGEDLSTLERKANEIVRVVSKVRGARDVKAEQTTGLPVLRIRIDRQAIARYGINAADVLGTVEAIGGKVVGTVLEGAKRFPLQVRLQLSSRDEIGKVGDIGVATAEGLFVPLAQLAEIVLEEGPAQISHENVGRKISIEANVRGRDISSFVAEAQAAIDRDVKLPPGYTLDWGGQFENLQAATERLQVVVPLALFLIFVLLYTTFGAIRPAVLIYLNVPFAVVGGILALFVRGMPFSVSAAVGFIALFGVAVLNGVVLISTINKIREEGSSAMEAAIRGAEIRLRPVLMTALVAALGFIPMALSSDAGAEVQKPLATVVIGGLLTSTLLTLVVLPTLYARFAGDVPEVEIE